ncbi:hypothetical protein [Paenibacillus azoreducens]|nr:hypothetical protein [Paenibacillus azoreducens]
MNRYGYLNNDMMKWYSKKPLLEFLIMCLDTPKKAGWNGTIL